MTTVLLWAAALLPGLIAYNVPPSPTLFNQAAALALWGAVMAVLAPASAGGMRMAAAAFARPTKSQRGESVIVRIVMGGTSGSGARTAGPASMRQLCPASTTLGHRE